MGYSKIICKNTLFVTNVCLQSYISNNVNALIMFIVHFYYYSPHFVYIPRFTSMVDSAPSNPPGLESSLIHEP